MYQLNSQNVNCLQKNKTLPVGEIFGCEAGSDEVQEL